MDITLLFGIAISLLLIIITTLFLKKRGKTDSSSPAPANRNVPVRVQPGIPRRAQIVRNQRNRLRNTVVAADNVNEDDEEEAAHNARSGESQIIDEKIGAKKRAKLEAKAEKKAQREAELQQREEKKKKELILEEERKKQDEKDEQEQRKIAEAERIAQEEQERKEYEEYLKMKQAFSVEEEGFEEGEQEENDNLLQEFIEYIKTNKVVILEDLANHFKLKTQQVIDRITELQKTGVLTGVIDDRGKFIFISSDELEAMAKFIRQRGRVSITELAESSNNLINLMSTT